jgi:P-type E1-E2 ATPase
VAFDKTGTLSRGKITVSGVVSLSKKYTAREVLKIAASCEVGSVHILARAIVDYAWDRRVKLAFIADLRDHLGFGIDARINGQTIVIGSLAHMRAHAIPLCRQTSAASIYLAVDRRLVGRIDFHDTLRAGALTAIHTLETLGIAKIVMVTGDNSVAAERVAGALGIGEVYAGKLPMDKVKIIQALEPKPTLYVGDGTNDAPTLAVADASIAMGAFGSPLSIDSAGIVIMSSDIGKIPVAIKIARATEFVAARSVFLGIGACLVLMLIATTGVIPAVLGAILQEVIDAASICSALAGEKVG